MGTMMKMKLLIAVSSAMIAAGCGCVNSGGQLVGKWSGIKEGSSVAIEFGSDQSLNMTFTMNAGSGETVILLSGQYKIEGENVKPTFDKISVQKSPINWEQPGLEIIRKQLNESINSKIEWKSKDEVVFKSGKPDGVDLNLRRVK